MVAVWARLLSGGSESPPIQSSPDTDKAAGLERILPLQAAAAFDEQIDGVLEALVPTIWMQRRLAGDPGSRRVCAMEWSVGWMRCSSPNEHHVSTLVPPYSRLIPPAKLFVDQTTSVGR